MPDMPDELNGLEGSDAEALRFALETAYKALREGEVSISRDIEIDRSRAEYCVLNELPHANDILERLEANVKRKVHIQEGIDRLEELNYRFPFILGSEHFHDDETDEETP